MAEEIGFENGMNSNFEGLVTLTLTLDPAIRHTVMHHSSTSKYIPNFIEIEETFCGRTDGRTFFPPLILLGRLLEVDLKTSKKANEDKIIGCRVGEGSLLEYQQAVAGRNCRRVLNLEGEAKRVRHSEIDENKQDELAHMK